MAENVTLEFLGAQFERVFEEMRTIRADQGAMRDDMRVLTAVALRHENTLNHMTEQMQDMLRQMRAMVAQHQRFSDRLRQLEERPAE